VLAKSQKKKKDGRKDGFGQKGRVGCHQNQYMFVGPTHEQKGGKGEGSAEISRLQAGNRDRERVSPSTGGGVDKGDPRGAVEERRR